jgi:NhaP-type Na+/H+ or K+/H+ antiporter
MLIESPTTYLAMVLALGMLAQWMAWRLRVPAIVLLLGLGFAVRYLVGSPEEFIPEKLLFPLVSLSVGVILFEGGLSLRFREIRSTGGVVLRLVTVGLLITWVLTGLAAYWILGFSMEMAALTGALLTVSGPTVIVPLLRQVRLSKRIGSVIQWEGIVNDPIGAVLAALVFQALVLNVSGGHGSPWYVGLGQTLLIGLLLGGIAAALIIQILRRYWIPDYLQSPVILAIVVVLFAVSNHLQRESGLVTVTLLGVILANQRTVTLKHVIEFKENLRVLLIATLFIVLASNVDVGFTQLKPIAWRVIVFVAALMLVIRPLAVLASTLGSELRWNERILLAWIHPRGIIAAAVASLLALELAHTNFGAEGQDFVLVVFLVIVSTVTVYGLTLSPLARRLGLSAQNPQGILFAGATPFVRAIAEAVQDEGYATLLVDTNHQNIAAARMAGLPVCFASIGSEYVQEETDFADIGRLLAMTANDEVNTLAAMEFAERFGRAEAYQLATTEPSSQRRDRVAAYRRGRMLFRKDATYDVLSSRWANGGTIKKTLLTQDFTFDDFRARYGVTAIVLFVVDEAGKLIVNTTDGPKTLKAGQKVIALVDPVEPAEPPAGDAKS